MPETGSENIRHAKPRHGTALTYPAILPKPNKSSSASSSVKKTTEESKRGNVEVDEIFGPMLLRTLQSLHKSPALNRRWTTIRRFDDDAERPVGWSQGEMVFI